MVMEGVGEEALSFCAPMLVVSTLSISFPLSVVQGKHRHDLPQVGLLDSFSWNLSPVCGSWLCHRAMHICNAQFCLPVLMPG